MWSFRFLAIKEPAQKKQASFGTLIWGFIPAGLYGNLDLSKAFAAVRSLYRNGMCKMLVSCQSSQGQLRGQARIVIYLLTRSLKWVCSHDCCKLLLKNKQINIVKISCFSLKDVTLGRAEKVEELEEVTTGVNDIWVYFLSFYILPTS